MPRVACTREPGDCGQSYYKKPEENNKESQNSYEKDDGKLVSQVVSDNQQPPDRFQQNHLSLLRLEARRW